MKDADSITQICILGNGCKKDEMLNLPDSRTAEFRLCASAEIPVLSY